MSFDKLAGIYVYCMNYHTGQWSREYRIMSRIAARGQQLTDSAIASIESNEENYDWFKARNVYQSLVGRYQTCD